MADQLFMIRAWRKIDEATMLSKQIASDNLLFLLFIGSSGREHPLKVNLGFSILERTLQAAKILKNRNY